MAIITEGSVQQQPPSPKQRERSDIRSGLLMGAPAFILLLVFLIGPFFSGAVLSFTNQRLISANPTEFVGLRNYQRLLSLSVLTLDPIADETTGERLLDEEGNLQFPRSREFTRDEENYPQYQGMTEWFTFNIGICPFHGDCLEGLASGPALQARWGQPAESLPPDDPAWATEASILAQALATFVCTLSPQRIILGGGVMSERSLFPQIRLRVQELLNGYAQAPEIMEHLSEYIVPPGLGNQAGMLGAVALAQAADGFPDLSSA